MKPKTTEGKGIKEICNWAIADITTASRNAPLRDKVLANVSLSKYYFKLLKL